MDSHAMFLNCPAYVDKDGATRCGLPAEVEYRYTMNSTDGPLESQDQLPAPAPLQRAH